MAPRYMPITIKSLLQPMFIISDCALHTPRAMHQLDPLNDGKAVNFPSFGQGCPEGNSIDEQRIV